MSAECTTIDPSTKLDKGWMDLLDGGGDPHPLHVAITILPRAVGGPPLDLPGQRLVWTPMNSEAAVSVSTGERRTASAVEGVEGGEW